MVCTRVFYQCSVNVFYQRSVNVYGWGHINTQRLLGSDPRTELPIMKTFPCSPMVSSMYIVRYTHCIEGKFWRFHLKCCILEIINCCIECQGTSYFSQNLHKRGWQAARRVQWRRESWRDYQVMECPFTLHLLHELFNKLEFTSCFVSDFHFYPIHFFCLNGISV